MDVHVQKNVKGKNMEMNSTNILISLLPDKALFDLMDGVGFIKEEEMYHLPCFPCSGSGLNRLIMDVHYELAFRRGKGINVEKGEVVVCEQEESSYWDNDWRNPNNRDARKVQQLVDEIDGTEHKADVRKVPTNNNQPMIEL